MGKPRNGNMSLAYDMHKEGIESREIARRLGVPLKTVAGYISKLRQMLGDVSCGKCEKHIKGRGHWFRRQTLCDECFLSTESSKCSSLPEITRDEIYHRVESIFDTCSQVPSRRFGGAQ
jgi:predicted amidophosphoribosyltransferase